MENSNRAYLIEFFPFRTHRVLIISSAIYQSFQRNQENHQYKNSALVQT
jgi:hypothetical protein